MKLLTSKDFIAAVKLWADKISTLFDTCGNQNQNQNQKQNQNQNQNQQNDQQNDKDTVKCPMCTVTNSSYVVFCETCHHLLKSIDNNNIHNEKKQSNDIIIQCKLCTRCTYKNHLDASWCEMCHCKTFHDQNKKNDYTINTKAPHLIDNNNIHDEKKQSDDIIIQCKWCTVCTYENHPDASCCKMCHCKTFNYQNNHAIKSQNKKDDDVIDDKTQYVINALISDEIEHGDVCTVLCPICHIILNNGGETFAPFICFHVYHKKCIDTWTKKKQTCPFCLIKTKNPNIL